jgi:hypothetical protein
MATVTRAWLFNLDAERELAQPCGYTSPRALVEQMRERSPLTDALCAGEAVVPLDATVRPAGIPSATRVLPWCPTPTALSKIRRLGLSPPVAPPLEVLQRVNHRRFQHAVAREIPEFACSPFARDATFVEPGDDLDAQAGDLAARLAHGPSVGEGWHLERTYGFAGKGARRISRTPDVDDRRWIRDSLATGGVLVEPWVPIARERSIHGFVDAEVVLIGEPCVLTCDGFGAPLGIERAGAATGREGAPLERTAHHVALALRAAGYFGPFGIDAFAWHDGPEVVFGPIGDLNARFTLGWRTGMGRLREAALERVGWGR